MVAVFSATGESLPSRNKWLKAEDCTRQPPIELFSVVLNAACYKWKDLSYELRLFPGVLCCPFLCLNGEGGEHFRDICSDALFRVLILQRGPLSKLIPVWCSE